MLADFNVLVLKKQFYFPPQQRILDNDSPSNMEYFISMAPRHPWPGN